jgi:hypothetical protein
MLILIQTRYATTVKKLVIFSEIVSRKTVTMDANATEVEEEVGIAGTKDESAARTEANIMDDQEEIHIGTEEDLPDAVTSSVENLLLISRSLEEDHHIVAIMAIIVDAHPNPDKDVTVLRHRIVTQVLRGTLYAGKTTLTVSLLLPIRETSSAGYHEVSN